VAHAPTETPDWQILGTVAGRPTEAPFSAPVVDAPLPVQAATPSAAPSVVEAPKTHASASEHRALDPKPAAPSSSDLLANARQALREQRWSDAATAYQSLVTEYPSTPEARMALVPLGNLEIDRLGEPAQGLAHLNTYIANGGPLDVEARLGQIRAYRTLGDASKETSAIDEFLSAHPNDLRAAGLRARRAALSPNVP
jgi:outer membrane protein assembly factor BamD (BamD/ComL family)